MKKTTALMASVLLVFGIFLCGQANAMDDGNELVQCMREYEKYNAGRMDADPLKIGMYVGYVEGIFVTDSNICCGGMRKLQQILAIVGKYLTENPERWNKPAYTLVQEGIQKACPCN